MQIDLGSFAGVQDLIESSVDATGHNSGLGLQASEMAALAQGMLNEGITRNDVQVCELWEVNVLRVPHGPRIRICFVGEQCISHGGEGVMDFPSFFF